MKTPLLSATAVALLALTACQSSTSQTTTTTSNTVENTTTAAADAPKVELPPSIKAEVNFRCHGDNSTAKVTFFNTAASGTTMAMVAAPADATAVKLTSPAAGKPYVADGGYSMSGTEKSIKLTVPGKAEQSCDA
jgi:hypothetical protein